MICDNCGQIWGESGEAETHICSSREPSLADKFDKLNQTVEQILDYLTMKRLGD